MEIYLIVLYMGKNVFYVFVRRTVCQLVFVWVYVESLRMSGIETKANAILFGDAVQ